MLAQGLGEPPLRAVERGRSRAPIRRERSGSARGRSRWRAACRPRSGRRPVAAARSPPRRVGAAATALSAPARAASVRRVIGIGSGGIGLGPLGPGEGLGVADAAEHDEVLGVVGKIVVSSRRRSGSGEASIAFAYSSISRRAICFEAVVADSSSRTKGSGSRAPPARSRRALAIRSSRTTACSVACAAKSVKRRALSSSAKRAPASKVVADAARAAAASRSMPPRFELARQVSPAGASCIVVAAAGRRPSRGRARRRRRPREQRLAAADRVAVGPVVGAPCIDRC